MECLSTLNRVISYGRTIYFFYNLEILCRRFNRRMELGFKILLRNKNRSTLIALAESN